MVCGKAVSTRYAKSSKSEPTFLNLDPADPKEIFTILIWTRIAKIVARQRTSIKA
jgi:hypothetical protein